MTDGLYTNVGLTLTVLKPDVDWDLKDAVEASTSLGNCRKRLLKLMGM